MKKRTIVGLGVCALAIGTVVGVIGTRTAKEAKADAATAHLRVSLDLTNFKTLGFEEYPQLVYSANGGEPQYFNSFAKTGDTTFSGGLLNVPTGTFTFHIALWHHVEESDTWPEYDLYGGDNGADFSIDFTGNGVITISGQLGEKESKVKGTAAFTTPKATYADGWYMVGSEKGWSQNAANYTGTPGTGNVAEWHGVALKKDETLAFVYSHYDILDWGGAKRFAAKGGGGAATIFVDDESSDHNFKVTTGGTYDIYLTDGYQLYFETHEGESSSSQSSSQASSKSTESTGTGYYLRGSAVGGWDAVEANELVEHTGGLGCILNVTFAVGDFKIGNADWSKQWGWHYKNDGEATDHVTVIGGAKDNFEAAEGEDNSIHCKVAAAYDIYLTANNYISIELHDKPTPIEGSFFVSTGNYGDGAKAYLYTWNSDEDKNADFPGLEINATNYPAATCTSGTNFNKAGGIWEIPTSVLKAKFIITIKAPASEEDPTPVEKAKSGDIVAADGIYVAPSATAEEAAGSVGVALQAKLVKDIEAAIVATENDTVCEVTQATAEALVDRYDHLTSRTAIDAATYWTYDGSKGYDIVNAETPAHDNISYADIVEQLRVIAGQNAGAWNVQSTANNLTLIITVSVIGVGLAAAGAMYLVSKKRRLQK